VLAREPESVSIKLTPFTHFCLKSTLLREKQKVLSNIVTQNSNYRELIEGELPVSVRGKTVVVRPKNEEKMKVQVSPQTRKHLERDTGKKEFVSLIDKYLPLFYSIFSAALVFCQACSRLFLPFVGWYWLLSRGERPSQRSGHVIIFHFEYMDSNISKFPL